MQTSSKQLYACLQVLINSEVSNMQPSARTHATL